MAYDLTQSLDFERTLSQRLNNSSAYGLTSWQAFTAECWFKLESLPALNEVYSLGTIGWGTIGFHYWYYNNAGTYQLLGMRHAWLTNTTVISANIELELNRWYHYAFTKTAGHVGTLYLDGVPIATGAMGSGTGSSRTVNSTVGVAWNNGAYAHFFDGKISLNRIWSTVRTQAEITANMCEVFGSPTSGLRAEHSLNNVLTDASGNNYTLTQSGNPVFTLDVPTICVPSPLNLGAGFFHLV